MGIFSNLFGGKKNGGCCNMEIVEEPEKKKGGCCNMEIVEEAEECGCGCCSADASADDTNSSCCEAEEEDICCIKVLGSGHRK